MLFEISASDINLADKLPVDDKIIVGTLENGLTYFIRENSEPENMAEFRLAIRAGSLLEDDDQLGLAHFVEHMGFSGTENFPGDSLKVYLNSLGFGFIGGLNAMTSLEYTMYILSSRTDDFSQLDTAIQILNEWASRMTFDHDMIDKERGIILEEMRGSRGAGDRMRRQMMSALFAETRYAERMPIGTIDVIENVDYQRIKDFYNDWYRPDLMAVIAVGDFDPAQVESMIHQHFSNIPVHENPRAVPEIVIPTHTETMFSFHTDPEAVRTTLSIYHKHPRFEIETIDDYRFMLIDSLLMAMLNNRFSEIARQAYPPFLGATANYGSYINPTDIFVLSATVDEHQIIDAFTSLITEIERAKKHGFHNSELLRAKASWKSGMERSYIERDKVSSAMRAFRYGISFSQNMPLLMLDTEFQYDVGNRLIDTIEMDDILMLLNRHLTDENRIVTITAPLNIVQSLPSEDTILDIFESIKNSAIEPFPETIIAESLMNTIPKRVKTKKPKHDKSIDLYTWTLKNGAKVYLKSTDFRNDEILFNSYRWGGTSQADDEIFNSARVANNIISESGYGNFDKNQLDIYLDDKIARISPRIGNATEGLSGNSSVNDLETLMQLIWLNFNGIRFDESAFTTWKNRAEAATRNLQNSPQNSFSEAISSLLYDDHFRIQQMSLKDIDDVNHQAAFDFFKSRFDSANGFNFFFVGNINHKELHKYIEIYIASLSNKKVDTNIIDRNIRFRETSETKKVYHGQDDRSQVRLIYPHGDFGYYHKDWVILSIIQSLLFESLNDNVREKMSGVYSISAFPTFVVNHVPQIAWNISFGSDPNRIEEIIDEVHNQLEILRNNEFEERHLQTYRETSRRMLEIQSRNNNFWLNQIISYIQNDYDFKDLVNTQKNLDSITREEIANTAREYINLEKRLTIILYPED